MYETIEEQVPLSLSYLWKAQQEFYANSGIKAWEVVPEYMTCNCFVAKQYTLLIINYLIDLATKELLDYNEPIYILELGSGSGKFGFLLARKIHYEYKSHFPVRADGKELRIVVVLSDFTDSIIDYWKTSSYFQNLKENEIDFAKIDAEKWRESDGIHLLRSNHRINFDDKMKRNPLICIANYLFDSLKQDAFSISNNQIDQWLITLKKEKESNSPSSSSSSPILESLLSNSKLLNWSKQLVTNKDYQSKFYVVDEIFNDILNEYLKVFESNEHGATFLLPVGSMRLINRLKEFANNRLLLIAGDKADNHFREFPDSDTRPDITSHDGCFSFTANFDAIGRLFKLQNGFFFHSTQESDFKVSVFGIHRSNIDHHHHHHHHQNDEKLEDKETRYYEENSFILLNNAFRTYIDDFGPSQYFSMYDFIPFTKSLKRKFQVKKYRIPAQIERMITHIFAHIRLSGHDPDLFFHYKDLLIEILDDFEEKEKFEKDLYKVWANYYFIPSYVNDIPFALGELFLSIGKPINASNFFKISLKLRDAIDNDDQKFTTKYNIAICLEESENISESLLYFQECLLHRSGDTEIKKKIALLQNKLKKKQSSQMINNTSNASNSLHDGSYNRHRSPRDHQTSIQKLKNEENNMSSVDRYQSRFSRYSSQSKKFENDHYDDDDDDDDDNEKNSITNSDEESDDEAQSDSNNDNDDEENTDVEEEEEEEEENDDDD